MRNRINPVSAVHPHARSYAPVAVHDSVVTMAIHHRVSAFIILRETERPPHMHVFVRRIENSVQRHSTMDADRVRRFMVGLQLAWWDCPMFAASTARDCPAAKPR